MKLETELRERFGKNLTNLRERADLSQEELGIRAKLHRTEISQLERGLRTARVDTLVKLAGALGVNPAELLAGLHWIPTTIRDGQLTVSPE